MYSTRQHTDPFGTSTIYLTTTCIQQKTRIGCSVQGPRKRESHTFATLHAASFDRSAPLQVHLPLSARGIVEHALGE